MEVQLLNRQRKLRLDSAQWKLKTTKILSALGLNDAELSVIFVSDKRIRSYNRDYRFIDKATDVLSFAAREGEGPDCGDELGDVFISTETAMRQSVEYGVTLEEEITRLLIHGVLHLAGYDHMQPEDARRMKALEKKLLKQVSD